MEDLQRKTGYHEDANEIADQLKLCAEACDRLSKEDYLREVMVDFDAKWGVLETWWTPDPLKEKGYGTYNSKRANATTQEEKDQMHLEQQAFFKKANELEKQDAEFLLTTIKNNYGSWWD